jgi:type I site-specific restriction endonuclease
MAKFTASHYEAIATMIGITLSEVDSEEWSTEVHLPTAQKVIARLTNRLIGCFERDNERFDRTRFIDATGQQSVWLKKGNKSNHPCESGYIAIDYDRYNDLFDTALTA